MKLTFALFFIVAALSPSTAVSETLSEYIEAVKQSNPDLHAIRSEAQGDERRASAAGYWDDPFFGIGPDQVPTNESSGGMTRYQLSQTIPFPGRLGARKDSAQALAKSTGAAAAASEREITVIAAQLYARAFYTEKAIAVNRSQQKLLSELLNSTRARYKSGTGGHHELILADVEASSFEADNLRLNRELKILKAKMNELKSSPSDSPIELSNIEISAPVPKSYENAIEGQPELIASAASTDAARAEVRSAKLSYFPDIVLQGMYMKPRGMPMDPMAPPESSSWGAMVGVSIPLFFFGKQANLSAAAKLASESAAAQRRSLENRLKTEWIEAEAQLETAQDLERLYKKEVVPKTELAARTARSAYVARRLPLSQFIDILRAQRTQSLELTAAEIDVSLAKLRKINLLSRAPQIRLAPMRPTLFGSAEMGTMGDSGEAVNMGSGMRSPVIQKKKSNSTSPASSGMEGM